MQAKFAKFVILSICLSSLSAFASNITDARIDCRDSAGVRIFGGIARVSDVLVLSQKPASFKVEGEQLLVANTGSGVKGASCERNQISVQLGGHATLFCASGSIEYLVENLSLGLTNNCALRQAL